MPCEMIVIHQGLWCGGAFSCQGHKPCWKPGPFSPVALSPKVCGSYSFWGWVIFDISDIDMQKISIQERYASLLLLTPSSFQACMEKQSWHARARKLSRSGICSQLSATSVLVLVCRDQKTWAIIRGYVGCALSAGILGFVFSQSANDLSVLFQVSTLLQALTHLWAIIHQDPTHQGPILALGATRPQSWSHQGQPPR